MIKQGKTTAEYVYKVQSLDKIDIEDCTVFVYKGVFCIITQECQGVQMICHLYVCTFTQVFHRKITASYIITLRYMQDTTKQ